MEIKDIICNELEERAKSRCPNCAKECFPTARRCSRSWMKKLDRYNLSYETVAPKKNEQTIRNSKAEAVH
ncbi:MAG: hypothetical protein ACLT76_04240 [Clostridium fessum]